MKFLLKLKEGFSPEVKMSENNQETGISGWMNSFFKTKKQSLLNVHEKSTVATFPIGAVSEKNLETRIVGWTKVKYTRTIKLVY